MSVRPLTRKLAERGTSLRAIVDAVRTELARSRRYLLEEQVSIDEIARRLGFSEASAFNHAFKRWFGLGPTEFRRELGSRARVRTAGPHN